MNEVKQAVRDHRERKKKDAAYQLWHVHGWTVEETAVAVSRPVIWVIQILKDLSIAKGR